jgi:hypothetical protein
VVKNCAAAFYLLKLNTMMEHMSMPSYNHYLESIKESQGMSESSMGRPTNRRQATLASKTPQDWKTGLRGNFKGGSFL